MPANSPIVTIIISVVIVAVALPIAIATIALNTKWVPNIILDTKTIKVRPQNDTTALEFGILTGPNDAVYAGSSIFLVSTIVLIIALVLIRHFNRNIFYAWLALGSAILDILGTIACCAATYILHNNYPNATSVNQIQYVDGKYNTAGRLYTRESWACSMNAFYAEKEGHWADKACSSFGTARTMTILLVGCAICLLGVIWWQIRQQGGLRWPIAVRAVIIPGNDPKGEYIDLRG